jgi:hypothetical protein
METLQVRKGAWQCDPASWGDIDPARTVDIGEGDWDPNRTDVELLIADDVDEDYIPTLVTQPVWKGLKAVRIKSFSLDDKAVAVMAMEGAFANIEHLNLHACYQVGDYTLAALAQSAPKLRSLCIDWSNVSDVGLHALLREGGPPLEVIHGIHLKRVTEKGLLVVHNSRVPSAYVTAPVEEPEPAEPEPEPEVETVDIRSAGGWVRDRVARMSGGGSAEDPGDDALSWGGFPAAAVFDNEDYDQRRDELSVDEIVALAPDFDVFRYQYQHPPFEDLVRLLTAPLMRRVRYLDLRRNYHTEDGEIARAFRAADLAHLEYLSIDSCYQAGGETIAAIVDGMPNLVALELGSTKLDDAGLERLRSLGSLRVLTGVFMLERLTQEAVQAFREARPDVRVTFTW